MLLIAVYDSGVFETQTEEVCFYKNNYHIKIRDALKHLNYEIVLRPHYMSFKKNDIKYLLLGHHLNDLFENFLIRIVRGSGLNGLISFSKNTKYSDQNLNVIRPLLNLEKKDLLFISKKVFSFFVKDPSNINEDYKRTRIRNLLYLLEKEGKYIFNVGTGNGLSVLDIVNTFQQVNNLKINYVILRLKITHII
jgi:tRNA(Ile)-lysidine synthase